MKRLEFVVAVLFAAACHRGPAVVEDASVSGPSTIIENVMLFDGMGGPARRTSVRLVGDRIAAIAATLPHRQGDMVYDGRGLSLAPGFIDTHSHGGGALRTGTSAMAALSQGITTVIVGQDGSSDVPLSGYFERLSGGTPVNVASYVGHGTVRGRVMGADYKRKATESEVAKMRELVAQEMTAGALGLSSGLEYDPGIYSSREEVRALAKAAGDAGGRYISHIRSEDRAFWDAIDEIIAIGRINHMPVQVSHMKLAMTSIWGRADSLISLLDHARAAGVNITADVYPYRFWQSGLTVLFPERNFADRAAAEFALREVAQPDSITLTNYGANRGYNGKTVGQIARERGSDPATTLMALIRESEQARAAGKPAGQTIIATSMVEPDIERIIKWPYANICTDGEFDGRHPRGYGSFTRVLGHYVRERHVVGMSEAIRKMTSLAADNVGLRNRGRIVPGAFADLVLFDTATVADRATPAEPQAPSVGIRAVWVNGVKAFDNAAPTGSKSGRPIRRGE